MLKLLSSVAREVTCCDPKSAEGCGGGGEVGGGELTILQEKSSRQ